jgi:hypothetical protein
LAVRLTFITIVAIFGRLEEVNELLEHGTKNLLSLDVGEDAHTVKLELLAVPRRENLI